MVVVSASATETARLLLNSRSKLFPHGAGNNNDWVGRNLQGHAYCGARGLIERRSTTRPGPGPASPSAISTTATRGCAAAALLANEFIALPYLFSNIRPPGTPRWGLAHKEFQRRNYKRTHARQGPVQEMPVFEARVEVDPGVTDHWGIPVARLSGPSPRADVEIARVPRRQGREPAQGGRRDADLDERARARA